MFYKNSTQSTTYLFTFKKLSFYLLGGGGPFIRDIYWRGAFTINLSGLEGVYRIGVFIRINTVYIPFLTTCTSN